MESSGRARIFPSGLNPLAPIFVPQSCTRASDEADPLGSGVQCEGFGQLPDEVCCRPLMLIFTGSTQATDICLVTGFGNSPELA